MPNQTFIREPSLQRLVQDCDAVADLVQTLIDRDRYESDRCDTIPNHDLEFTTEWQMEASSEEIYSG